MRLRPDDPESPPPSDASPARMPNAFGITGLAGGTRVLTDSGWLPVEMVGEGDHVMTLDRGPAPVTRISRRTFGANISLFWPNGLVYVPGGALGPAEAYYLLPGQPLMLRSDLAAQVFDDPAAMVPAATLVGLRGICRVMPIDLIEVTELRFEDEAEVEIEGGTWLRCPGRSARVQSSPLRRRRVFAHRGAA